MTAQELERYTVDDFIRDAGRILAEHGQTDSGLQAVGERLRVLGAQPDIIGDQHLEELHGSGSTATILRQGETGDCALMLARFPAEAPTPVHNHNSWGIALVIRGRDRYLRWERLDDATDPEHAELRLAEELELGPGEFVYFHEPPHDIHSQQGIGDAAWELVFFGANPNRKPRSYFDPERGTVTYDSATRYVQSIEAT